MENLTASYLPFALLDLPFSSSRSQPSFSPSPLSLFACLFSSFASLRPSLSRLIIFSFHVRHISRSLHLPPPPPLAPAAFLLLLLRLLLSFLLLLLLLRVSFILFLHLHRHVASSLSTLSCLVFPPASLLRSSILLRGEGGVRPVCCRLIYESHASNPVAPRGTANDMCFSTLGLFYPLCPVVFLSLAWSRAFPSCFFPC